MGAFIISPLPPFLIPTYVQQGPLAPRTLLRFFATTGLAATVSPSIAFPVLAGYTIYLAPPISRWDEDGFSSCSACPCHRATPTTPPKRHTASVSLRHAMLPSPYHRGLGLRIKFCRGHLWVHFRCGPVTRSPSQGWLCRLASSVSFSSTNATQATGI